MNRVIFYMSIVMLFTYLFQPNASFSNDTTPEKVLDGIDAFQAMKIANDWKWSNKEIKSSVYPHAIVFKLPNGRIKRIALPKDRMLVAVAPYIDKTHK